MDTHIHIAAAGFPEDITKAINADRGNVGDETFRVTLAQLLKEEIRKYSPKAYVRFDCEISIEQTGENQ